ncbi:hypothetical protein [Bdellovibrio sp. NC01]|uniref:hypothetical protein n=1 Tax=Bdellovibrio sp. NC01 TaxID=2220073 RepID=UPI00115B0CB5|nr:hypothetical protein [Bdellovibrio sp. NC01]QDK38775.1 hypothetical protein DOE51_14860 [Bdellovibrio sp. NC01]
MKSQLKVLIGAGLCLSLVACEATDAIKSANQIPAKMDQTNQNMSNMLEEMKKTTSGVHDQSLLIPMENILKEENHDSLSPVPFKLMPYGKKFAEAATAQELIDLTYLWLKEVDESLPAKDIDETTGSELPYTRRQVAKINNEKIARLVALQVIAGFTPQTTVDEIVRTHIVGTSSIEGSLRFEETAYSFLMLRTMFIRDVLLNESLLSRPLDNVGKVEESMKYAKQIDSIAKYRFAAKIQFKSRGLIGDDGVQLPEDSQPQEQLSRDVAARLWRSIFEKAQSDLKVVEREVGNNTEEDKKILDQERKRASTDLKILESYVKSWDATLG